MYLCMTRIFRIKKNGMKRNIQYLCKTYFITTHNKRNNTLRKCCFLLKTKEIIKLKGLWIYKGDLQTRSLRSLFLFTERQNRHAVTKAHTYTHTYTHLLHSSTSFLENHCGSEKSFQPQQQQALKDSYSYLLSASPLMHTHRHTKL